MREERKKRTHDGKNKRKGKAGEIKKKTMDLLGGTREKKIGRSGEQRNERRKQKRQLEREGVNKDYFSKEDGEGLVIMKIKEKIRREGKGEGEDIRRAMQKAKE